MVLRVRGKEFFGVVDHLFKIVGHLIEIRVRAGFDFLRDGCEVDVITHRFQEIFVPDENREGIKMRLRSGFDNLRDGREVDVIPHSLQESSFLVVQMGNKGDDDDDDDDESYTIIYRRLM